MGLVERVGARLLELEHLLRDGVAQNEREPEPARRVFARKVKSRDSHVRDAAALEAVQCSARDTARRRKSKVVAKRERGEIFFLPESEKSARARARRLPRALAPRTAAVVQPRNSKLDGTSSGCSPSFAASRSSKTCTPWRCDQAYSACERKKGTSFLQENTREGEEVS